MDSRGELQKNRQAGVCFYLPLVEGGKNVEEFEIVGERLLGQATRGRPGALGQACAWGRKDVVVVYPGGGK